MSNYELHFSYSTLRMLKEYSHCWINKQLKIKPEERWYFTEGKDGHRIIQDHIGGIKKDPRLAFLEERFSQVEERDFDEKMKFTLNIDGYKIIGFADAKDPLGSPKRIGEIKLSSTLWTIKKYQDSIQRKIYSLAFPDYPLSVLITGSRNPNEWCQWAGIPGESDPLPKKNKFALFDVPNTEKDKKDAEKWIKEGLAIFEAGDFNGGLDENGRCISRDCPWGANCHFKNL